MSVKKAKVLLASVAVTGVAMMAVPANAATFQEEETECRSVEVCVNLGVVSFCYTYERCGPAGTTQPAPGGS